MVRIDLRTPALRFDEDEYDVADLVLLGLADGSWQRLERRLARGLALEREHGRAVGEDLVLAAMRRFRYARRLIAGKELRDWLAARGLALEQLRRHCLRELLVEEHGPGGAEDPAAAQLHAEAVFSGTLAAAAQRLAELAAMASATGLADAPAGEAAAAALAAQAAARLQELPAGDLERRAARIVALRRAEAAFAQQAATPDAVRRCLAQHGVDWMRVACSELTLASEGAAREALLCLRVDGMALAELCEELGTAPGAREHVLADLPPAIAPLLASAAIGDPAGPFEAADGWHVVVVDARIPASAEDDELAGRATVTLVRAACERAKAGRVRELAAL